MKAYLCDICGASVPNPIMRVFMQEITTRGKLFGKKKRIHLCDECLKQIAENSRNKGGETNAE